MTHRPTHTHTQIDKQTGRQTARHAGWQGQQTNSQSDKMDRETHWKFTDRHINRWTRQIDEGEDRRMDGWMNIQEDWKTDKYPVADSRLVDMNSLSATLVVCESTPHLVEYQSKWDPQNSKSWIYMQNQTLLTMLQRLHMQRALGHLDMYEIR